MTSEPGKNLDEKIAKLLLEREVEDFIVREAAVLDEWRLDEWLSFFTDDARYMIPSTDKPGGDPKETLGIINDDMARLRGRVERLKSRHAHREFPWSRTRRFITNVRIKEIAGDEIQCERLVSGIPNTQRPGRSAHRRLRVHLAAGRRDAQNRLPQSRA